MAAVEARGFPAEEEEISASLSYLQESETSQAVVVTETSEQALESTNAEGKKTKKIIRKKRRPARVQIDASEITADAPPQTGLIFNIWYNKWAGGDREDKYLSQTHAKGRCNVALDSGYTRGDKIHGSYFCLYFARGICPRGHECEFLHRIPNIHDHFNPNVDCFGREKHNEYRDDMGGVGSFMRQNRTIYVGRIFVTDDIEEVVARHFAEWGEVERIRVLTARGVAFVTYSNEANSSFAKEAMAHQSLDHDEILNVRWATVDPNPMSQKREARRIEEQAAEAVRRALPAEFVRELEGRDSEATKRKRIEGTYGLEGYEAPDSIWYSQSRAVTGSGAAPALENGSADADEALSQQSTAEQAQSSIFSGSTLSALSGLTATDPTKAEPPAKKNALLVGYGSDEDDD